ncbi:hypothetical protein BDV18DRAFT_134075 [Aspergillus unguis]
MGASFGPVDSLPENYIFANHSAIPAPLDKILPLFYKSWDDPQSSDGHWYLDAFAPEAELVFGQRMKGHDAIRAFRTSIINPKDGPIVDLEHTMGKCFVLPGAPESGRQEVLVNGTIWYQLKNGVKIEEDYASLGLFVDQGDGDYKIEFYEVYVDSLALATALKELSQGEP